jgi:hypothetical protein
MPGFGKIAVATDPINDILSPRDSQRAAQAIRLTTRWLRSYKTNYREYAGVKTHRLLEPELLNFGEPRSLKGS